MAILQQANKALSGMTTKNNRIRENLKKYDPFEKKKHFSYLNRILKAFELYLEYLTYLE